VDTLLGTIAECKAKIREDEMARRKLHAIIQELKVHAHNFLQTRAAEADPKLWLN
jgi:hypothetical protein